MTPDACSGLPEDSSELARIVVDRGQPAERRSRAMAGLLPRIQSIAQHVARRFSERLRQDLIDEAGSMVWARLEKFDPSKGRFEDWCRIVVYRAFLDEWRRGEAGVVRPAGGGELSERAGEGPAAADDEAECVGPTELRRALDRIAWHPACAGNVHYYAVLLLQLRLVIGQRLGPVAAPPLDAPASRADLVAWCLPWNAEEEKACIRSGWPTLRRIWYSLCPSFCDSPFRVDAPKLCETVSGLLSSPCSVSAELWNQWVRRAKTEAQRRLHDERCWQRLFSRLLPDR